MAAAHQHQPHDVVRGGVLHRARGPVAVPGVRAARVAVGDHEHRACDDDQERRGLRPRAQLRAEGELAQGEKQEDGGAEGEGQDLQRIVFTSDSLQQTLTRSASSTANPLPGTRRLSSDPTKIRKATWEAA